MALVQPTNLFPSSFRGGGGDVIDASVANTFSLQLNGSSACVAYSLEIMQNNAASTTVYSTSRETISPPIYPRNHLNETQRLEIVVPSSSGMVNGYANGYKWKVTLWWDSTHYVESADTFFKCEATPYFTVVNPPSTVSTKSVTLTATYTQADGVPLEWYRWTMEDSRGNIVADTGEVFSEDIQITVDGLLNGESFTYLVVGQTQSGVEVGGVDDGEGHYSNTGEFSVAYDAPSVQGAVSTSCDSKTGAIHVSLPEIRVIVGQTGSPTYIADTPIQGETSIQAAFLRPVTFNTVNGEPMSFPDDATHIWSGIVRTYGDTTNYKLYQFTENNNNAEVKGELVFWHTRSGTPSVTDMYLSYTYNGQEVFKKNLGTAVDDHFYYWDATKVWMVAVMHKYDFIVEFWSLDDGLTPSLGLVPRDNLYPSGGTTWASLGRYTT